MYDVLVEIAFMIAFRVPFILVRMALLLIVHGQVSLSTRLRALPAPILETLALDMLPNALLQLLKPLILGLVLGVFNGNIRSDGLVDLKNGQLAFVTVTSERTCANVEQPTTTGGLSAPTSRIPKLTARSSIFAGLFASPSPTIKPDAWTISFASFTHCLNSGEAGCHAGGPEVVRRPMFSGEAFITVCTLARFWNSVK